jgi:hypothetical protein
MRRWRINLRTTVHIAIATAKSKRTGGHLISDGVPPTLPSAPRATACAPSQCRSRSSASAPSRSCRRSHARRACHSAVAEGSADPLRIRNRSGNSRTVPKGVSVLRAGPAAPNVAVKARDANASRKPAISLLRPPHGGLVARGGLRGCHDAPRARSNHRMRSACVGATAPSFAAP